jgi:hypothetical protein
VHEKSVQIGVWEDRRESEAQGGKEHATQSVHKRPVVDIYGGLVTPVDESVKEAAHILRQKGIATAIYKRLSIRFS